MGGNMHGSGKYTWQDGKEYCGQYIDDKKTGYGVYKWPDERKYKGYWLNGKQHGLAEYETNMMTPRNHLEITSKYGLWEGGRRIKWFTVTKDEDLMTQKRRIEEEVLLRNKQEIIDCTSPKNKNKNQVPMTFNAPQNFTINLTEKIEFAKELKNRLDML